MINQHFLDAAAAAAEKLPGERVLPWPMPGSVGGFVTFAGYADWKRFFLSLQLNVSVPDIVQLKYDRALKLHLLAWIDMDLIKAGELVSFTALELALKDSYLPKATAHRKATAVTRGHKPPSGQASLADILAYMVEQDGLTDQVLGLVRRTGGSVIDRLTGQTHPALNAIRNDLAHGYPFDGFPQAGLLELVRDLIDFAYRQRPAYSDTSHPPSQT